jgi:hypothetical protein
MSNEKQQTALDYYSKKIGKLMRYAITGSITGNQFGMLEIKLFEESKEMEKKQIIKSVNDTIKRIKLDEDKTGFIAQNGEGYFNETYGGNK